MAGRISGGARNPPSAHTAPAAAQMAFVAVAALFAPAAAAGVPSIAELTSKWCVKPHWALEQRRVCVCVWGGGGGSPGLAAALTRAVVWLPPAVLQGRPERRRLRAGQPRGGAARPGFINLLGRGGHRAGGPRPVTFAVNCSSCRPSPVRRNADPPPSAAAACSSARRSALPPRAGPRTRPAATSAPSSGVTVESATRMPSRPTACSGRSTSPAPRPPPSASTLS